jgi:hypothetical protein
MTTDLLNGQVSNILNFLAAAGGLGTAAFGLVDATKAFGNGVSNSGFKFIRRAVDKFIGGTAGSQVFGRKDIMATLKANWINGAAKADQKATSKSLIRLCLTPENAEKLAKNTGIDPVKFKECVTTIRTGAKLSEEHLNLLGEFDAIVSAVLDEGYERADQKYRNASKVVAAGFAVVLAIFAGGIIFSSNAPFHIGDYLTSRDFLVAILVGIVATPLAPIAKDLSTTLSAAIKAVSAIKR